MKLVIEIPESIHKKAQDGELSEIDSCYISGLVADGKPLPKDATNGDLIKSMFPDVEIEESKIAVYMKDTDGVISSFGDTDWWNAPYKGGNEDGVSN